MTHTRPLPSRRGRRLAVTALVSSLTLGAALLPAATASAEVPNLACPQATAVVGFPIPSDRLLPEPTPNLGVTITGALPAGLSLHADATRAYLYGTPTRAETATFTISAVLGIDGTPVTISSSCTMKVKPKPKVTRIAGTDRYDQSAKVSRATYDSAGTVYIASGEKFADALSASSVAAHHDAPLLLTPAAAVTTGVLDEIARLAPKNVVVVGGPASVSDAVLGQLAALTGKPTVTRITGADRFEVSRNLIGDADFGIAKSDAVYIAAGATFPDALGASPVAAKIDAPVLLVNGGASTLSSAETATLTALGATKATVVGGPASVSPALVTALATKYTTTRVDGEDRFKVNGELNRTAFTSADRLYVASGTVFPDALSGGAAAGQHESPLYISPKECLAYEAYYAIGRLAPDEIIILGGTATLDPAVENMTRCPGDR
ncbi:cell wall-binding repeat-containing protein [Herbiconiux sp. P15]|uniref:cell wall-binding repeat-containing protein n=1 Tax=Herbiconiux liukaitaii TaxID=3342799 RepID=UPI0035B8A01A